LRTRGLLGCPRQYWAGPGVSQNGIASQRNRPGHGSCASHHSHHAVMQKLRGRWHGLGHGAWMSGSHYRVTAPAFRAWPSLHHAAPGRNQHRGRCWWWPCSPCNSPCWLACPVPAPAPAARRRMMYVDAFPSGVGRAEAGVRSQLSFMICCTSTWGDHSHQHTATTHISVAVLAAITHIAARSRA
jgi:hypothetical protein